MDYSTNNSMTKKELREMVRIAGTEVRDYKQMLEGKSDEIAMLKGELKAVTGTLNDAEAILKLYEANLQPLFTLYNLRRPQEPKP